MTPSGIERAIFRLLAPCHNQLRHQQRAPYIYIYKILHYNNVGETCCSGRYRTHFSYLVYGNVWIKIFDTYYMKMVGFKFFILSI